MDRVAVIGAMDEEIEEIKALMLEITEEALAGIRFYIGELHGMPIALCKSGVGKVNAAICSQLLISQFDATHVIFTGVAGGVHPALNIGDIVISSDCLYHDIDASALGYKKGEIPFAENSVFSADENLITLAKEAGEQLTDVKLVVARVLSGDQFIADKLLVNQLYQLFDAGCVEMEGAAVGHVCTLHQVPFVIIRSLSDKADGSAQINFVEFVQEAAKRSSIIVEGMLRLMKLRI
jgi:adenosylhomocysteine nucleosidase